MRRKKGKGCGWFVYPRADGWMLKYKDDAGEWRQKRLSEATSKRDAEEIAVSLLPILLNRPDAGIEADRSRVTLARLADDWIKLRKANAKLSPSTKYAGEQIVGAHVLTFAKLAHAPLPEIGPALLKEWIRHVGKGRQPSTTRNIANVLTAFFDDVLGEEWSTLATNPMRHEAVRRELPSVKAPELIVHLPLPDARALLACEDVTTYRRTLYLVAMTSGLRAGELHGLRWSDVDLDAEIPVLHVRRATALIGAKGWATESRTKTDNARRTLPLHSAATAALRRWKDEGWAAWVARAPEPADLLFPNPKGQPWRPNVAEWVRDDLEQAKCATHVKDGDGQEHAITFHALRRSCASWLAAMEVPADVIGIVLGHAGKGTAARHYTAKDLARLSRAFELIDLSAPPSLTTGAYDDDEHTFAAYDDLVDDAPDAETSVWSWGNCPKDLPQGFDVDQAAKSPIWPFLQHTWRAPPAGIGPATFGLGRADRVVSATAPRGTTRKIPTMAIVVPIFGGTFGHRAEALPQALPQGASASIGDLTRAIESGVATGDLDAARAAHDALGALLSRPAALVDLASKRARRAR